MRALSTMVPGLGAFCFPDIGFGSILSALFPRSMGFASLSMFGLRIAAHGTAGFLNRRCQSFL